MAEIKYNLCECCRKKIPYSNNKYCSACAVHSIDLRQKINYLKRKVKALELRFYVTTDGRKKLK
jgi:hypothetical protein